MEKAIERLRQLPIDAIAPSHGLIWRKAPSRIMDLYQKWSECVKGEAEPEVTLLYGSMYGNTEEVMNAAAQGVSYTGVPVEIFDVARTHASHILPSLWVRKGVIVGAPTYEGGLFPPMAHLLDLADRKRIINRKRPISAAMDGAAEPKESSAKRPSLFIGTYWMILNLPGRQPKQI